MLCKSKKNKRHTGNNTQKTGKRKGSDYCDFVKTFQLQQINYLKNH